MSFDGLAKDIAGALAGVFGDVYQYDRRDQFVYFVPVIVRRNAEAMDGNGQIIVIEYMVRIAKSSVTFTPKRGDTITRNHESYKLGQRVTDSEGAWEFEASKC